MAFELFKLAGSVFIDTKEADKSLSKTETKAVSFGETFGKVAGVVGGVATVVVGSATAIGGAMISTANKTAETADEIDKASIRMGISAEQFQEYAYVAGQCGVETATLEQACKKLEGTDISFDEAISSIMSLETAEERAQKASELFGEKVAYTMTPMLAQSGEEFDKLIDRSHELGLIMGDEAVKNGVEFGDLLSDLKQSLGALAGQVGSALFPILNKALSYALEFIPQLTGYVEKFAPLSVGFMEQLLPILFDIVDQIFPILVDLASQLMPIYSELISNILPIFVEILNAIIPLLMNIIQMMLPLLVDLMQSMLPLVTAILPLLEPIATLLLNILTPLVDLLSSVLPPLIAFITQIVQTTVPLITEAIKFVGNIVTGVLTNTVNFIKPMILEIIGIFSNVIDFIKNVFTGNWEGALQNIVNIGKGILNLMIDYIEGFINFSTGMFNTWWNSIFELLNNVPFIDIPAGFANIPEVHIPRLEKGGTVTSGGRVLVGEKAPEILDLPAGARVTPLDKAGIGVTKDDIADAMKEALLSVGIQLELHTDEGALVDRIENINTSYRKRHGGASMFA